MGGPDGRPGAALVVAGALSAAWLVGAAVLIWLTGGDHALWFAAGVALALPLVGVWLAALLARQAALVRREAARLASAERAAARSAEAPPAAAAPVWRASPPPAPPPHPPARAPSSPPAASGQARLPFAPEPEACVAPVADLARALDFPESPTDREGFRALRLALRDPRTRRLVQASQDMLTLLSEDGIFMDDLAPAQAAPALWRRFAHGERGEAVAAVGDLHADDVVHLTAERMRADPVFRDAAHHFLRLFDRALADIAADAGDTDLTALARSRTARAFAVTGSAAGMFR